MTVWQKTVDKEREQTVADVLREYWRSDVSFDPTPKYFPSDFHMTAWQGDYGTYIGDLEVKWLTHASTDRGGVFNFNKLLLLASMPMWNDGVGYGHWVAFRYTDGVLMTPVSSLLTVKPAWFTRRDTGERDLVVHVPVDDMRPYGWIPVVTE